MSGGYTRRDLENEQEFRKCQKRFSYFFISHWKVIVPGRVQLAEHRESQIESANVFQDERRVVVLKARQIGWSTLVAAYCFWKAFFYDSMPVLVLSRREDPEARAIIAMIRLGYDNLPLWMRRRGPALLNRNLTKLTFANGSYVDSDASKDNPARGRTVGLLVMDEFGKFPNPEEAWGSALPATEHGQLIAIGNPNGYGTRFWSLYNDAKAGRNDFRSLFYPWWVVPGRDKVWYDAETSSMTPAQRSSEFCDDDESCWNKAGSPVFDVDRIQAWPIVEPVIGVLTPTGFRSAWDGELYVWQEPRLDRLYVMGADPADGLEHGDFSAVAVIDANSGDHVAEFAAHLDAVEFARFLDELGRYYNRALLGVERNRNGTAVITNLREIHRYPRLYQERVLAGITTRVRHIDRWGWNTTAESKAVLVNDLWRKLCDGTLGSRSLRLFTQMAAFRYRPDGTMTGSPHDDILMSYGIAAQMLKAVSIKVKPELREAEEIDWSVPQFAFGNTLGEWEEWDDRPSQRVAATAALSRTTPRAVRISAVGSSRASSTPYGSAPRSNGSSVRKPRSVVLNSDVTQTRGRITR